VAALCTSFVVVAVPSVPAFAAVTPSVALSSAQLLPLIGEQVTFNVAFDNTGSGPSDTGYGPYVDLRFNAGGADGNDGITFSSASYLGSALAPKATFNCTGTTVVHPLTGVTLGCPLGTQLVVLQLPYGSFTADQPVADIGITANISNLADVASPQLAVTATPGFAYGDSPTGSTPIVGSLQQINFTPQVLRFTKTYVGPENETATGPNYPRRFRLAVDIANGQRVNNLTITDRLPIEYQFTSVIATSGATNETLPSTVGPMVGNELVEQFVGVAGVTTGTSASEDAFVLFEYFIPDNDATPALIIDPSTGDDELTRNDGQASGTVDPLDVRDADQPFTINPNSLGQPNADDAEMTAKSIAVQKSVTNVTTPGSGAVPGDVLEYTISGQVSDYFTFAGIDVNDVLGDGQTFDGAYTPTLIVTEGGAPDASIALSTFFTVDVSARTACGLGTTDIDFAVSDAYAADFALSGLGNGAGGVFTGGRVNGTTGPATFEITFRAVVDDSYTCMPGVGNKLDSNDFVTNAVTVTGEVYDNATQLPQTVPLLESDDSSTRVDIRPITLHKSIWARNNVVNGFSGSPARFAANDDITYRLMVQLPSSDFSDMSIGDYLPLPVLTATSLTQGADCTLATAPAVGQWCYGPADTFHDVPSFIAPVVAASAAGNSITWSYGTQEITDNIPRVIELLFTLKISNAPFREGLFLTNQAQMFESNSFGTQSTAPAIIQIELTEPFLNIDKGVVARTAHTGSASSGTVAPTGVTFDAVGTPCVTDSFTGTINSGNRNNAPAANVTGLDAHDIVRFAILVENTGAGLNGAFDVTISDAVPAGFQIPGGGAALNLCVTNGAGTAIPYTPTGFFTATPSTSPLGTGTIELTDTATGALAPTSPSSGTNIAVITYDLELVSNIGANTPAASLTNTATITNYAATAAGPSFVAITPLADLVNTATVATAPIAIAKVRTSTSETSTSGANVVIGEEVEYTVTVTFPEGLSRNVSLVDTLPAGLAISRTPGTAVVGSALTAVVGAPTIGATGHTLTYTVGDVQNNNSDNTTQANETITFNYWAVVLDVASNQQSTNLSNSARVSYHLGNTGSTAASHVAAVQVTVIEPSLTVVKTASAPTVDAGDPLTYTIVVTNSAVAIGHDVTLTDTLPDSVTYVNGSLTQTAGEPSDAPPAIDIGTGIITAAWDVFPAGGSATLTLSVTVDADYDVVTPINNTATVKWTSLPGSSAIVSADANALERTGAGGVNDYTSSSTAQVQAVAPQILKSLVSTDQATTTANNVTIGEVVTYDLRVTLPDGAITGFTVTDLIPAGLQYVAASAQVISSGAPLAQSFGGTLGGATPTGGASNGDDLVMTFGATSNPADGNALNNAIVVRLQALVLDVVGNKGFNPGATTLNNSAEVRIGASTPVASAVVATPVVEPHLAIIKTFAPTTASQGDTVTVNLAVQNNGLAIAHDVVISDALDSHLDETLAAEGITPAGFTYGRTGNTITYTASPGTEIAVGATVNFSFTVPLDAVVPIGTAIPNTAIVTRESTLPGTNVGEREEPDVSSLTTLNSVGPDLQLTKDDHVTTVSPGTQTTYDLVVRNVGGFQATGVSIVDTLPPATTFVSVGGASCADGGAPVAGARTINISGAITATNGTVTCTITIAITSPAPAGTSGYLNSATVSDDGVNGADPNPGDNTATDNDTIAGRAPNLVVTKNDGQTTRAPGQSTTYTVTVTNTGNIGVTNVAVTDSLPAGLTFVSCTPGTGAVSVACANNSGIVTISYASLAGAGGATSFAITANVDDPIAEAIDSVDNVVTVVEDGANGVESNLVDNTAHDIDTIDAVPDMVVVKTHPGTVNVAPGGTVTYEVLVSNVGDQHATGVVVVDTVDPQMNINCGTVSPAPTSCVAGTGVITWGPGLTDAGTISGGGVFAAGETQLLTYTATTDNPLIANTVDFDNTVTVATDGANGADPTPADNTDADVVPLTSNAPELGVTKTDGVGTVVPGADTTYTLVVTNSGNIGATAVTLTDMLPAGLEFVSCTGGCDSTSLPLVTWDLGTIVGGGGQATVTLTAHVTEPAVAGITVLTNPASVTDDGTNGADPVPGNNATSDTDTLEATPDLVVTKDDGAATRSAGEQFDYTVVVRNVGGQAATGITVVDTLPDELTAVACPATPVACVIDADLGTVTWSVGDLNGGAALATPAAASSITLTLTVVVDSTLASGITDFTNIVRADDDGANGIDPTPLDNEASDTDLLLAVPDLQIVKSDGVTAPVPGDELIYEIVVTNAGTQAATSATVNDVLPPGVTFVSCAPACDSSLLPTLTWTNLVEHTAGSPADPSAFDALGQATLVVTVSVDSPAIAGIDDLDNVADVTDDATNGLDPTPGNNITHDVDVLDAAPDLAVTKSDGVPSVVGGQTVTYGIQFGNDGTQDATGVVITDVLPAGVTFVSCSDSCDSTGAPAIVWNVGDLDVGEVHTYQLTVEIDAPVATPTRHFVNNVSIADDGSNGPDLDPSDNDGVDDDTTGIDLAVTKTDGVTTVVPGTAVSYIITVTNNGPTTIQSFTLQDTLPAALQGVTFTPSVGTYDSTTREWSGFGDFAENETVTLAVAGTVNPSATGTLTNTVVVTPPANAPDTDPSNNTAVDVDDLTPTAVLVIDKQLTTALVRGQQAVYTISVRNNGPSVATSVSVTDALPDALSYVSGAGSGWTCSSPASIGTDGRPVCDFVAPLAAGESRSFELTVLVSGDFGTTVINEATVSSAISVASSSVLRDTAQADIAPAPTPPAPDLPLPRTGASPMPMLRAAAFLIVLGTLISLGGRRRRIVR
jgi:uncharacterized repeat protein (TIGR01451 family)/fimbrial isopeptide formation D2 family protein